MKRFYFVKTKFERRRQHLRVYRLSRKGLVFAVDLDFSYGSTKGEESEVLNVLAMKGFVPKKYKNKYFHEAKDVEIKGLY